MMRDVRIDAFNMERCIRVGARAVEHAQGCVDNESGGEDEVVFSLEGDKALVAARPDLRAHEVFGAPHALIDTRKYHPAHEEDRGEVEKDEEDAYDVGSLQPTEHALISVQQMSRLSDIELEPEVQQH